MSFGFPAPGHPYWTDETLDGVAARYPGMDMAPSAWLGRGRSRPARVVAERARTTFALRGGGPAMGRYRDAARE